MKKKIACFFPTVSGQKLLGGSERRLSRILSNLPQEQFDISIVLKTVKGNSDVITALFREFCTDNIKLVCAESNFGVMRHFHKQKYDWVMYPDCCFRALPVIFGAFTASSERMVLNVNSEADILYSDSFLRKKVYGFVIKVSNRVDCLYPWIYEDFKKRYPKKNITFTPCSFTDLDKFSPSEEKEKTIVFSGRLTAIKNPDLFVDAMVSIKDELIANGYKCLICGDGKADIKDKLISKIKEGKAEEVISITGYVDMAEILSKSSVFCSLQKISNYPSQALIEAIACGNYCIATKHQNDDLLIKPEFAEFTDENTEALAAAVSKVMRFSDERWVEIRKSAREFALDNCKIDNQVNHYKNLLG